jgi:hypothetical protein
MTIKNTIFPLMVLLQCLLCATPEKSNNNVDIIIFSYDRPLQLYAFLESIDQYCVGVGKCFVLYRASDKDYEKSYKEVMTAFHKTIFIKQNNAIAPADFKPLLCDIVCKKSRSKYIAFGVDDIVVCDDIDLRDCVVDMETSKAFGFYLRLGHNITGSYFKNRICKLPAFKIVNDRSYAWHFSKSELVWNYPHSVDMTIFSRAYSEHAVKSLTYKSPNSFEQEWSLQQPPGDIGLCFDFSKLINIPLNLVQEDWHNKNMGTLSAKCLLEMFKAGLKMDISPLRQFRENKTPHIAYIPSFKPR